LRAHIDQAPSAFVAVLVAAATTVFAWVNISNAEAMAPQWSQDLAFFHQWIHSAANGGPWASPLILEPQGFFDQVHTHLVLPAVVGLYKVWSTQTLLLWVHSFFVSLAIWPAFRLAENIAGGRHALLCTLALVAFGPFQGLAVADFRPVGLFLPGLIGVWYGARRGSSLAILGWATVALLGRQEASYLLMLSGGALLFGRWGRATRKHAIMLLCVGATAWLAFAMLKPAMFFHINPMAPSAPWPSSAELWDQRLGFGLCLVLSGWSIGILSPLPLLAAAPIFWGFLSSGREWHAVVGPGAHHHVFWLPFVVVAGIAAASKVPKGIGPVLLLLGSAMAFPWAQTQTGPIHLERLVNLVPEDARVAADYETIHRLSGRPVLWNIDHLYMPDRPWHWTKPWPLTEADVDWILMPSEHALGAHLDAWNIVATEAQHILLQRP